MRAVVYDAFEGPLRVETVADPTLTSDGVIVRVHATGLCRSDWHGWQGHDADIAAFPHVPGHEFAGTIEAVGSAVTNWHIGDRVTVPFVCACGDCPSCARGDGQVCDAQTQPGFTHWGSFAELVAVRHADVNLVALPDNMSFATAAGLGCRFATAFRAIVDRGAVKPGHWVAIFGCGGVGLSAVMIARALGARPIAIDVSADALALAQAVGAEHILDARIHGNLASTIYALTGGGADVTCDALGSAETARDALASLRKNGRHVQVGLLAGADENPALPLHLLIARELEIVGSHGMAAHAYPRMLRMVASGELHPERLITRRITLDETPAALSQMVASPHAGVTIIEP